MKEQAESHAQLIADAANDLIIPVPIIEPEKRWLWLTLPNCGFAVEVLRQQLERDGISAHAVVNRGVTGKRFDQHVLLHVEDNRESLYIDPTYLQLFSEFGFDSMHVVETWESGKSDVLPPERTLVFSDDSLDATIGWLMGQVERMCYQSNICEAPPPEAVKDFFKSVYDLSRYEPFAQIAEQQALISEYLDEYQPGRISTEALFRHFMHRRMSQPKS